MKTLTSIAGVALTLAALGAQAHARLTAANPKEGAEVTAMPTTISLTFSESARVTAVSIQKDAEPKQKLKPPTTTGIAINVDVPSLAPGAYTLSWRVMSTDDNHIMSGQLHFKVAPPRMPLPMTH